MNVANTPNGYSDPQVQGTQYQKQNAAVAESKAVENTSPAETANEPNLEPGKGPRYDHEYAMFLMNRMRANAQNRAAEGGLTISGKNTFQQASSHRQTLLYDENGFSRELQDPLTVEYFEKLRNPKTEMEKRRAELHRRLGGLPSMDKSAIPKENFLDAALEQYKKEYAAIESKTYELGNQKALQISVLDLDFMDYVQKGFEQSQLNALRKLNEISPNLIKQIQYSNYSFDYGV